jgi:hypothetical protein
MKKAILVGLLLVAPSSLFAQRELHMKVAVYNPGNYIGYVDFRQNVTFGHLDCSQRWKGGKVKKGDTLTNNCTASTERVRINRTEMVAKRELELTAVGYANCHFNQTVGKFSLKVYNGSHKFQCTGCRLEEDWSGCPASGTCTVNVHITLTGNAPYADGCSKD